MRQFGLIGYPLSHSFSKNFFSEKFERERISDARYDVFPLEKIEEFPYLLRAVDNLAGLNVTAPHKESIIPYLDQVDSLAKAVGAVNTIRFENGRCIGYNTDLFGFEQSLMSWFRRMYQAKIFTRPVQEALLLGTGGAAKAIEYVCREKMFMNTRFVSRNPKSEREISYDQCEEFMQSCTGPALIVNCTPLGTFPENAATPPLNYDLLNPQFYLYDLVYNPELTTFMQKGLDKNCYVKNGLEMLHLQAERSWEIWNS
jgi:shikimate dehydrogenase